MDIVSVSNCYRLLLNFLLRLCYFFALSQSLVFGAPTDQTNSPQSAGRAHSPLAPHQLAVIINDDDDNSVKIGEYYRRARQIPAQNLIHVNITGSPHRLTAEAFAQLKHKIDVQLAPAIQAVVMLWTAPYAVECNSITAAFTLGFDASLCAQTCAASKPNLFFNSVSQRPFDDYKMRLSMLLPTNSLVQARALIDRGVISGFAVPTAGAYYLTTSDTLRNARARFFPGAQMLPRKRLTIHRMNRDYLDNAQDVMIYQIGSVSVPKLESLRFMPGALADHMTSLGGDLLETTQMSSLRWLDAGATASYGTVSEPCNYWQKFPQPSILLSQYLTGASAIEAYWKSVAWPAQGVFIGEPLAAPYRSRSSVQ